jgi:hypothetical protein
MLRFAPTLPRVPTAVSPLRSVPAARSIYSLAGCPEHGVKLLHIGRRCNMRQGALPARPVGVLAPFIVSGYSPCVCGAKQGAACAARAGHYRRDG